MVSIITTGGGEVVGDSVTTDVILSLLEAGGVVDVTGSGVDEGAVMVGGVVGSVVGSVLGTSEVVGVGVGVSEGVVGISVVGVMFVCEEVEGSGGEDGTVVGIRSAVLLGGRSEAGGDDELERVGEGPAVLVEFVDMVKRRWKVSDRGLLYIAALAHESRYEGCRV